MGNSVGLSICDQAPVIPTSPRQQSSDDEFIPCQICKTHFRKSEMKGHIDLNHYANIKDGKNTVQCILCSKQSNNLVMHTVHMAQKHSYAEPKVDNRTEPESPLRVHSKVTAEQSQMNKTKKTTTVKLVSQTDFQILEQIQTNHYEASVKGIVYDVVKYVKQYKIAAFNQQLMQAELIWFNIFKLKRKCKYYYLDLERGQKNILCKVYIFISKDL